MLNLIMILVLISSPEDSRQPIERLAAELEARTLAYREGIHQGEIELKSAYSFKPMGKNEIVANKGIRLFFDGDKLRSDILFDPTPESNNKIIKKIHCVSGLDFIDYTDAPAVNGGTAAVRVLAKRLMSQDDSRSVIDGRLLGLIPFSSGMISRYKKDYILGSNKYISIKVEDVVLGDVNCKKITKSHSEGNISRIWIAADRGPSVMKVEYEFSSGGQRYIQFTESAVEIDNASGIWFPARCESKSIVDGEVTEHEVLTMTSTRLNKPIPSDRFSLADLGIPAGHPVVQSPASMLGILHWDGNKLVSEPINPDDVERALGNPSDYRRLYLTGSLLVALLGIVILCVAMRWRQVNK